MDAFGFVLEDLPDHVQVWSGNWMAFRVFEAMGTQWRTGMGGPVGLDYAALPTVFDLLRIKRKARLALFDDIRVMEDEALAVMAAQRRDKSNDGG